MKLPDGISFEQAASMMLQGLTVQYLMRRMHVVPKAGDTILWHAAAGGIGLIACQWAKALGVNLIGTVSSRGEGGARARARRGAHHPLHQGGFRRASVNEITGGKKVPVVYDSVGKDTFLKSLDCLQVRGLMVIFGNSSGPMPPFDAGILDRQGLALRDAAVVERLRRQARRAAGLGEGSLRHGAVRQGEGRRRARPTR